VRAVETKLRSADSGRDDGGNHRRALRHCGALPAAGGVSGILAHMSVVLSKSCSLTIVALEPIEYTQYS
jgi:hypothetical protein